MVRIRLGTFWRAVGNSLLHSVYREKGATGLRDQSRFGLSRKMGKVLAAHESTGLVDRRTYTIKVVIQSLGP